jgi:hypothetical protein
MKPNTKIAMADLIKEARKKIPFDLSFDGFCEGRCDECPEKLLEFLSMELNDWESRLKRGDTPNLGDVEVLARACREVYVILQKEALIDQERKSSKLV